MMPGFGLRGFLFSLFLGGYMGVPGHKGPNVLVLNAYLLTPSLSCPWVKFQILPFQHLLLIFAFFLGSQDT